MRFISVRDLRLKPGDVWNLAKKEKDLILTEVGDKTNPQIKSLSKLIDANNLIIFKKKKPKNIPL